MTKSARQFRGALLELGVRNLGVIDDLRLLFGPGMTALTGETGAGKTMLVEAIELLVGGRADADLVRPGADEATVEGRFELDGEEVVLTRVDPAPRPLARLRRRANGHRLRARGPRLAPGRPPWPARAPIAASPKRATRGARPVRRR